MKYLSVSIQQKYKIEICLVNLALLFYLFRNAIPIFKYPFLLLYIGLIVYSVLKYKNRIISSLVEFIRNYYLILILTLVLIISFLSSNKLYLMAFKDLANTVILLSMFLILTIFGIEKKEFKFYTSNLVYLIALFSVVISISGVLNVLGIFSFTDISQLGNVSGNVANNQLPIDYNFAIISSFFGIFVVFYIMHETNSKRQIVTYNILLILFSLNIILSGSRRGLFTLIAILVILLGAQVFAFFKKNDFLKKLGSNSKYFLISFCLLSVVFSHVVLRSDYAFKVKVLEFIGVRDIQNAKVQVVLKMMKYTSIFKNHSSYKELYSRIWPTIPEDPDSGWGIRPHKTIFPLTGKNIEIVPKGIKGYLLDSTTNVNYYDWIDLSENFTLLVNLKVNKGERYKASVFCFASHDFDGSLIGLSVQNDVVSKGIVFGTTSSNYNFREKGIWQKLEIEFECNNGEVPVWMSFQKNGVRNFRKLKGFIIFAYPHFEKILKSNDGLSLNTIQNKNESSESGLFDLSISDIVQKSEESSEKFEIINHENNISGLYNTQYSHNEIVSKKIILNKQKHTYSGMFYFPISILSVSGTIQKDSDPIRKWASKFISEDTTYYPYKLNIEIDTVSNPFIADRLLRWEFALEIFSNEYNWKQKIFGGGFNFLNWYGYYFLNDKTMSDYPHNPFLHILLYSGILGLSIYSFFLFKVFYYYIKYAKVYPVFFIFFFITFFFSFFSSGSPCDPPIMGFFVILPFFIHSIHKK